MVTETRHVHDLRVDPSQVIIMVGAQARVRIGCAVPGCEFEADVYSYPSRPADKHQKDSWRPYVPRRGDEIKPL